MRFPALSDRILKYRHAFTPAEHKLAEYILRNGEKLAFLSAERLGEQAGVSDSTVARFARTLGFDGYSQLQSYAQEQIYNLLQAPAHRRLRERSATVDDRHPLHLSVLTDVRNLEAILDQVDVETFDTVVKLIVQARQKFVVGLRGSAAVALLLGYNLRGLLPGVRLVGIGFGNWLDEILDLTSRDIVVAVSLSREARGTVQFAEFARRKGARVIAIVNNPLGPLAGFSDYVLPVESDSKAFNPSFTAALSLVQAILAAVGRVAVSQAEERLAEIDAMLVEAGIFVQDVPQRGASGRRQPVSKDGADHTVRE